MKVTFATYDNYYGMGGPNVWLRRLLPALRARGVESRVLCLATDAGPYPTVSALEADGFACALNTARGNTEEAVQWICDQLAEHTPDVFVPNLVLPALYASRWVRQAGIPAIGVLHSDDDFYRGMIAEFVRGREEFRLSGVVCVSEFLERQLLGNCPSSIRVKRIGCGTVLPPRTVEPPSGSLRMAYVGRFAQEQKRILDVARALCRAVSAVPDCEAVMYGEGPESDAVESIIAQHSSGHKVRIGGLIDCDAIQSKLLECHVFVLLSDYEGLPVALMEAMACGVVPICLRIRSGINELIEDGVTGLLVEDREEGFLAAVRRLREEPGLWERLSKGASARIAAEYSNEKGAARWDALLREMAMIENCKTTNRLRSHGEIKLPPIHPGMAYLDKRRPSFYQLGVRRMKRVARRVKNLMATVRA